MHRVIIWIIIVFFLGAVPAWASDYQPHLEEGIYNEQEYREVTFITGKPVVLTGTVQKSQRAGRNSGSQTSLTYKLSDSTGYVKLSRNVSYSTSEEKKLEEKQTVYVTTADRLTETISVGSDKYTLTDYVFSKSTLVDNKPAVDYFSGNWSGRKTYTLGREQAKIVIETWGDTVGYTHAWGSTETQRIDGMVKFSGEILKEKVAYPQEWSGTFQINISFNQTRELSYQPNEPTPISFAGGYLETIKEEGILRFDANLPEFDNEGFVKGWGRQHESGSTRITTMPTQRRLPVPLLRDISGHWAEGPILELASLEAFPVKGEYFGPRLNMTRGEFARSLAKLAELNDQKEEEQTTANPFARYNQPQQSQEISPFADVDPEHPYYQEIKAVSKAGIIKGTTAGKFNPGGALTRAQAITAMIRALGFEGLAPFNQTPTPFRDDSTIPYWARDAVYVAAEMGLVSGDAYGNVLPNETMSRAEAATFLQRFIHYLQWDMKTEYRERLINFR